NAPRSPEACAAFGMAAGGGQVAFLLLDTEGLLSDTAKIRTSDQMELDLEEKALGSADEGMEDQGAESTEQSAPDADGSEPCPL
ncbi:MAG: hypothetical protein HQL82_15265, partial [Magnetococcales bacterium]|nr:hypothetical protein [Magnetococcales bacterium]